MVGPVCDEQRQRRKAIDDGVTSRGPTETLEQFLEYQPRREDALTTVESVAQAPDTRLVTGLVTSQCQRPNARTTSTRCADPPSCDDGRPVDPDARRVLF